MKLKEYYWFLWIREALHNPQFYYEEKCTDITLYFFLFSPAPLRFLFLCFSFISLWTTTKRRRRRKKKKWKKIAFRADLWKHKENKIKIIYHNSPRPPELPASSFSLSHSLLPPHKMEWGRYHNRTREKLYLSLLKWIEWVALGMAKKLFVLWEVRLMGENEMKWEKTNYIREYSRSYPKAWGFAFYLFAIYVTRLLCTLRA